MNDSNTPDRLGLGFDDARFEDAPPPPRGVRAVAIALGLVAIGALAGVLATAWVAGDWLAGQPPLRIALWPDPGRNDYWQRLGEPRADLSADAAGEAVRSGLESARIAAWTQLRDNDDLPDVPLSDGDYYPCAVNADTVVKATRLLPRFTIPENTRSDQERTEAAVAAIVAVWADAGITPTDPISAAPGTTLRFAVPEGGEATLEIQTGQIDVTLRTACIAIA